MAVTFSPNNSFPNLTTKGTPVRRDLTLKPFTNQTVDKVPRKVSLQVCVCLVRVEMRDGLCIREDDATTAPHAWDGKNCAMFLRPLLVQQPRVSLERIARQSPEPAIGAGSVEFGGLNSLTDGLEEAVQDPRPGAKRECVN